MKKNHKNNILFFFLFIASLGASFSFFIFQDFLKQSSSLGLFGLFLFNCISSASFFTPAPAFLSVIATGAIYPPAVVAIVASAGSAIGDTVGYVFGISGRTIANHKLSKKIWFQVIEALFARYGGIIIFFFAFVPNFAFDSIGIIAGIFGYSPKKFILWVFFGRFLRFFILSEVGNSI